MKSNNPIKGFLLGGIAICALLVAFQTNTFAAAVIHDTFATGSLDNRKPDTVNDLNLTWAYKQKGGGQSLEIANGRLKTGYNSWLYLDIRNSKVLTRPTVITLSADLCTNNFTQNSTRQGLALGFYSTPPANSADQNFTGLLIEGPISWPGKALDGVGVISLWYDGVNRRDVYHINNYDANATYNLKYTIDTTTGNITAVFLNNTVVTLTKPHTGIFTAERTSYVATWARSNSNVNHFGYIDNVKIEGDFVVSQAPEPATVAALRIGTTAFASGIVLAP
ncbi:hypothetical protein OpiT1DRAFT_05084 [Opitutaceae bacterium TAV1]|nr:hypothetical protein OpiT1DRAFT_05084 [Opitutaceae bacterium TAV1]